MALLIGVPKETAPGASLVGFASYIDTSTVFPTKAEKALHEVEVYVGILIGAITFSGSLIAFGKLSAKIERHASEGTRIARSGNHRFGFAEKMIRRWSDACSAHLTDALRAGTYRRRES